VRFIGRLGDAGSAIHPPLDCKSGLIAQVPLGLNFPSPLGLLPVAPTSSRGRVISEVSQILNSPTALILGAVDRVYSIIHLPKLS
jgi:hypothetical protein